MPIFLYVVWLERKQIVDFNLKFQFKFLAFFGLKGNKELCGRSPVNNWQL